MDIEAEKLSHKFSKEEIMTLVFLSVIILIEGIYFINIKTDSTRVMLFIFGYLFFLSGHFVGMYVKKFGLIFLFSHSLTGICFMVGSLVGKLITSPLLSDISQNAILHFQMAALLIIAAIVYIIVYNLNDKVKTYWYSSYLPLVAYVLAFAILGYFSH